MSSEAPAEPKDHPVEVGEIVVYWDGSYLYVCKVSTITPEGVDLIHCIGRGHVQDVFDHIHVTGIYIGDMLPAHTLYVYPLHTQYGLRFPENNPNYVIHVSAAQLAQGQEEIVARRIEPGR